MDACSDPIDSALTQVCDLEAELEARLDAEANAAKPSSIVTYTTEEDEEEVPPADPVQKRPASGAISLLEDDSDSSARVSQEVASLFADVDDTLLADPQLELPMSNNPFDLPCSKHGRKDIQNKDDKDNNDDGLDKNNEALPCCHCHNK